MQVRVRFTVEENYRGWRLDRYLQDKIRRLSRAKIQWLSEERLEVEPGGGAERLKPSTRVVPGLSFALVREAEPEPETPLEFGVLHDDGALLVVDKPAGLPVHPTARYSANTFTAAARARFPGRKVDPAHRLDRETSGLLACGSAPEWTKRLKASFAAGRVAKTYLAFALGRPSAPDGAAVALLACRPRTGRQHQIRAHLHHAGLPLVGDKIYGEDEGIFDRFSRHEMTEDDRVRLRLGRQALHAWRLELPHPQSGERVGLEAPLPEELARFWESCAAG